jgi:hypothetical protein
VPVPVQQQQQEQVSVAILAQARLPSVNSLPADPAMPPLSCVDWLGHSFQEWLGCRCKLGVEPSLAVCALMCKNKKEKHAATY